MVQKRVQALEPATLTYRIDGGSVLEGGYLRESGHTGIKVLFNEGSKVVLTPGTRGVSPRWRAAVRLRAPPPTPLPLAAPAP